MTNIEKLIDHLLVSLHHNMDNQEYMTARAILSPTKDNVGRINLRMTESFQGEEKIYHRFHTAEIDLHGAIIFQSLSTR